MAVGRPFSKVSDFSADMRTMPYPSYFVNGTEYEEHMVSPKDHQAVLNEIAARPSNFGYGLGNALMRALEFINDIFSEKHSTDICTPGDKAIEEARDCVTATVILRELLFKVEKAEDDHLQCLIKKGISEPEARARQWKQRPGELQTHSTLFSSVGAGPYKTRGYKECKEEAIEAISQVRAAEEAEQHHSRACRRYRY